MGDYADLHSGGSASSIAVTFNNTREVNMNKLILSVLCAVALCLAVVPCFADTVNGVLAEERVVNLPQDAGKWYISVVGNANDARYNEIVGWFSTNASLKKLKNQVHFCQVTSETAAYKERYAGNIKGLPTVRMQRADGTVIYEAAGKGIPLTASGLNGALANGVNEAQGIRPILPWRRDMENRCRPCPGPGPCPNPNPGPDLDPEPQPLDDSGPPDIDDTPVVESDVKWVWLPVLCILGFALGVALSYGRKLYEKLHPPVK
jgi:hypothetical protein